MLLPVVEQLHLRGASVRGVAVALTSAAACGVAVAPTGASACGSGSYFYTVVREPPSKTKGGGAGLHA